MHFRSLALIVFVLLSFRIFGQSPLLKKYQSTAQKAFQEQNAYNTVAYVEKRWRLAGNTGFNESIYYVENILKKAGYVNETEAKPTDMLTYRIEKRPMNRQTWEPIDAKVEIVGESEPLLEFKTNRNMLAINSGTTPPEGIEAEVVYIDSKDKQTLEKADLNGKILFVEQGIGLVHRTAAGRGAVGAFGYSIPAYTQPQKFANSIQFSGIQIVKGFQSSFGILLSTRAKDRLKAALAKGPVRVKVKTETKLYPSEELTLVADIKGNKAAKERFVFSAHVQEPGANDNATGVGTLAEMARVAAEMYKKGSYKPERSLTFLWGDEIVSTRRYVTEDTIRAKGIQWGMSLDMVGEDTQKTGGTFLIEKMPDPSAVWTRGEEKHSEWGGKPLPENAIKPHYFNDFVLNRCLDQAKTNGWVVKTNPYEGGSDHTPFLQAGLPGLLMWHFTDVFYHTDADRLENVSAWEMKNVGISALVSAMTLTSTDESTALVLVKELQEAATKRLDIETKLSLEAIQKGNAKASEAHILEVWGSYYENALGKMENLQASGTSDKVRNAIGLAQKAVKDKTEASVKGL
ncbi:M28 family peptidase [Runella sp.]|uniref:M28 family peptidase n=1 Tax=Runella sp. TaxID=1960881 RepID=UPI003D0C5411